MAGRKNRRRAILEELYSTPITSRAVQAWWRAPAPY